MMRPLMMALTASLLAAPLWAQSAPEDLLDQAMLLGPARLDSSGGRNTIFGEAGANSYVASLSGTGCAPGNAGCTSVSFQAVAQPAQGAVAAWQAAGLGGTLTEGGDGWLVLSLTSPLGDAATAFQAWGALIGEFGARFGN